MSAVKTGTKKPSWKRIALRVSITLAISAALGGLAFWFLYRDAVQRFNYYLTYADALNAYYELHGEEPPDIRAMEQAYLAGEGRAVTLPPPPPFERPEYRPIKGLADGEYILFVEPPSPRWYSLTRTVIYTTTDGQTRVVAEPRTKVEDLLAKDDERRRARD